MLAELAIREFNTGVYLVDADLLWKAIAQLDAMGAVMMKITSRVMLTSANEVMLISDIRLLFFTLQQFLAESRKYFFDEGIQFSIEFVYACSEYVEENECRDRND